MSAAGRYTTREGDVLDEVCFRFYGSTLGGQVEAVLEANAALDLGRHVRLAAGLEIVLPMVEAQARGTLRLFS